MDTSAAHRTRRAWLMRWWGLQFAALYFFVPLLPLIAGEKPPPGWYGKSLADPEYIAWTAGLALTFAVLQWLYLRPVRAPATGTGPVRLVLSMLVAGFVVSALLIAIVLAGFGIARDIALCRPVATDGDAGGWMILGVFVVNWAVATPLLLKFASRSPAPFDPLRRIATVLFAGSVIEVLAVIPLDLIARRHESCWCGRLTMLSMMLGLVAGAIVVGPFVFLVLIARQRRRWPGGRCGACGVDVGYDMSIPRCPGCGAGWAK